MSIHPLFYLLGAGAAVYLLSKSNGPANIPTKMSFGAHPEDENVTATEAVGASDWILTLPENVSPERERAIYDAVRSGFTANVDWIPIRSEIDGHSLELFVMADCLRIGSDSDSIRVSCSHRTQQLIADGWVDDSGDCRAYLCTSKIADLVALHSEVRIGPTILSSGKVTAEQGQLYGHPELVGTSWLDLMGTTMAMREYHRQVEAKTGGRGGLISDAGKYWVNTPRLGTPDRPAYVATGTAAANYGFYPVDAGGNYPPLMQQGTQTNGYSHGPGGMAVYQNVGLAHDIQHSDYSQTCRLVGRYGTLDGQQVDLQEVASDPGLCKLVSDEGPVLLRHPAIPFGTVFV